jgi:hypothetical protein
MTAESWLGRADAPWNILLTARLTEPPAVARLRSRLASVYAEQGWPAPEGAVVEGAVPDLLEELAGVREPGQPVSVGRADDAVVVRADHAHVDGLGLLAVLGEVLAVPVSSSARGVGRRPSRGVVSGLGRRLVEALVLPPAGVTSLGTSAPGVDAMVQVTIDGPSSTSDLGHAAVRAVVDRNGARRRRDRRVSLAVGVSTVGGHHLEIADRSGFLRLPGAQSLRRHDVARALTEAPLEIGGTARGRVTRLAGPIRRASSLLAPRLGSTILVSHLGTVQAPGAQGLAFHPVAANGSGVSLGAVTLAGRTTLTLRARGAEHDASDLRDLLDAVVRRLAS